MSVQIIPNDDADVSAIISVLEASGFKATVIINAGASHGCPHSPVTDICCRECNISRLQDQYCEDELRLQRTGDRLREAIIHG